MKILETRHDRKQYFLIFDGMEIIGKYKTYEEANNEVQRLNTIQKTKASN